MTEQIEYFQHELAVMREAVDAFGQAYPTTASELRLSAGQSSDPHVEQLLQSFVWLTSRLRCDLEQQRQEIPNHLLLSLYPHLLSSIPSMAVMEGNVLADGVNYVNSYQLEKGRLFSTWSHQRKGGEGNATHPVECRMQCCYETDIWPLTIDDIQVKSKNSFEFLDKQLDVSSVISISISSFGSDPLYEYPLSKLRFFIADPQLRPQLYDILSNELNGIALRYDNKTIEIDNAKIRWLGFDESHNVLPQSLGMHNAYRLLLEYFYFPEKFYFFEIEGLDLSEATNAFELLISIKKPLKNNKILKNSLSINSFPVINLFSTTFIPVQLDYRNYEYRIVADESQYGHSEVHSISDVRLMSADGGMRHAEPWLSNTDIDTGADNDVEHLNNCDLGYISRLVSPISPGVAGADMMISLYDATLTPAQPVDQTLSAKGLCCNRELPESLLIGNSMKLLGAGAMSNATLVSRPTLFKAAQLNGESTVKLLSQLHLNQLSLMNNESQAVSLDRLKQLLSLYCDPMIASHRRQIEGIKNIESAPSVRRMGNDAWRGHYRGTSVNITVEESLFEGVNALLLGEVLSHFFGLYTSLNHFVQLNMKSTQREGVWKKWPVRIGEQIIL